jgi:hypothetical protein
MGDGNQGRNADLQGQGSPLRDDAGPPQQGWRGEKTDGDESRPELRHLIDGQDDRKIEVEEASGSAFAERTGTKGPTDKVDDEMDKGHYGDATEK